MFSERAGDLSGFVRIGTARSQTICGVSEKTQQKIGAGNQRSEKEIFREYETVNVVSAMHQYQGTLLNEDSFTIQFIVLENNCIL